MSAANPIATDLIKPHYKEAIKQYLVYDELHRMVEVYECIAETRPGGQCLKTEYEYDEDSNRIIKMVESLAEWQEGWDIA